MPDSGKFKDLYLNSAHTYPCQPPPPRLSGALTGFDPGRTVQCGQGVAPAPAMTAPKHAIRLVALPGRQRRN